MPPRLWYGVKLSHRPPRSALTLFTILIIAGLEDLPLAVAGPDPPPELARHLAAITALARSLLLNFPFSFQAREKERMRGGRAVRKTRNSFGHDTPVW